MGNRRENRNKYAHLSREKKEVGFEKEKVTVVHHEKRGPAIQPIQISSNNSAYKNDYNKESLRKIVSQGKADLMNGTLNK